MNNMKITQVQGNVLRLAIPLTLRTKALVDGVESVTENDYIPGSEYPVRVVFSGCKGTFGFPATTLENVVIADDMGTLPVGEYSVEVLCRDNDGTPRRFKQNAVVRIVDATDAAALDAGDGEFNVWMHYPVANGRVSAIVVSDSDVTFTVGRRFVGDQDKTDDYADAKVGFGSGRVEVDEQNVTLNI